LRRREFLTNAAGLGVSFSVPAFGKGRGDRSSRTDLVKSLDGPWQIAVDPNDVGRGQKWESRPRAGAKVTWVPSIIQESFPHYHGVVWYWHDFSPCANNYKEGRYLLRFWGVDYLADVWLNGHHVGAHEGGETPFVLDVSDAITPKIGNRLAVRVLNPDNKRIDGIVLDETPHQHKRVPYRNGVEYDYGGIMQPVDLLMTPVVRVEDVFVRPDWKTGRTQIQAVINNAGTKPLRAQAEVTIAPAATGEALAVMTEQYEISPGHNQIATEIQIGEPHLWSLEEPYLYRVTLRVQARGFEGKHEMSVLSGFRDFRVVNGFFELNGRRVFLRSSITLNHSPVGLRLPPRQMPDLLRRDMVYSKASGFNTVRFAIGMAYPYQLDLCDEIGLMAYEETYAADSLKNSSKMKERFDRSVAGMILRDRNHPSIIGWGLLNETDDGPVFRHAVESLSLVRSLDDTRLVLLSSGRFDGDLGIGSVSNPGSSQWECVWGNEAPGAPKTPNWKTHGYPSVPGVGDFHYYPIVPPTHKSDHFLRTLGADSKPVFLSEYGVGSLLDAVREAHWYEQIGARPDLEDNELMHSMAERFIADWNRLGMDGVYPFPEDMLRESQRRMAWYRTRGFNLIRSNPQICGYDVTAMLDGAMTGGGVWRFWRDWKPEAMDAMQDGWSPLRWCLFVEPSHSYRGRTIKVEAVLANEGILPPGKYPVHFRIWSDKGVAWDRRTVADIPQPENDAEAPLAVSVHSEEIRLNAPPGAYKFVANLKRGGAPFGRTLRFFISDATDLPKLNLNITAWEIEKRVEDWLNGHGVKHERFGGDVPSRREIILVGDLSQVDVTGEAWSNLARRMAHGSVVVFLSPFAFKGGTNSVHWLPLSKKGRLYKVPWLSIYHNECVAKRHPIFDGMLGGGIMDWDYYGPLIPKYAFQGQDTPDETVVAVFGIGQMGAPGGYDSGIVIGAYKFAEQGRFILNTLPVLEHLDLHPAADRILLNLINYAANFTKKPSAELPPDFEMKLKSIGYPI